MVTRKAEAFERRLDVVPQYYDLIKSYYTFMNDTLMVKPKTPI